jgi:hydrogenase maturation protein HypF
MPMPDQRIKVVVHGAVQGVGYRPFVYRLADQFNLRGWVLNSAGGVVIEAEGDAEAVRQFVRQLEKERPARAVVHQIDVSCLEPIDYKRFEIRTSDQSGDKTVMISPDTATCADCLREMFDRNDRRFRYPFTNCTHCGPRFTIIETLPYDRPRTTMKGFRMCVACAQEYHDPRNRRFHAQPNGCPCCGPQLALWNAKGDLLAQREEALLAAAERLRRGEIIALKGIGGFQLLVDARNEAAVKQLRGRKRRGEKPFAVMAPSLDWIREACLPGELEEQLLSSAEAPIVLLSRRPRQSGRVGELTDAVAPDMSTLGVMLAYSPLHHLLMHELGFPVVATSGNLTDEPICIDEHEAVERLGGIADGFLVHDRPIVRPMDDSVVQVVCGREMILRRARGYAPLPIRVAEPLPTLLAVGAHLKSTVALSSGRNIFISQHLGDLETQQAYSAFRKAAADLPNLYDSALEEIVCDLHPDYLSTQYATELAARTPLPIRHIQHHWAHVAACMAENGLKPPALGIAWDGTGYGSDGVIWGGEFLLAEVQSCRRVAHWRSFRLPGGEAAIKEPRRCALGMLHEVLGDELWQRPELLTAFSKVEVTCFRKMLANGFNAPMTTSAGRLFDAVVALARLRQRASFEGQAAMELEAIIPSDIEEAYPFRLHGGSPVVVDWEPMIRAIIADREDGATAGLVSAKFHNMLVEVCVAIAQRFGEQNIVLTGGCFQNRALTERTVQCLTEAGFRPYWHRQVPPNDGGIALGQVIAAVWSEAIQPISGPDFAK